MHDGMTVRLPSFDRKTPSLLSAFTVLNAARCKIYRNSNQIPGNQHYTLSLLQATVAEVDLGDSGVDTAEEDGLAVGQVIHGIQRDVKPGSGVVDGKDINCLAVVGCGPACSTLWQPSAHAFRGIVRFVREGECLHSASSILLRPRRPRYKGTVTLGSASASRTWSPGRWGRRSRLRPRGNGCRRRSQCRRRLRGR